VLFNSLDFIFFFTLVILFLLIIKQRYYQHLFLLGVSYFFYIYSGGELVVILLFVTLLTFYCGNAIGSADGLLWKISWKKIYLFLGTLIPLLILGYFKYFHFFLLNIENVTRLSFSWYEIILPLGISFYTFHGLSYIFDIYLQKLKPSDSLLEYVLYIAFFPQLIAGPIVRAREFLPQMKHSISITSENFKLGLMLMMWGWFKKSVIADNIAPIVTGIFTHPLGQSSYTIIQGTLLFGIQIYCDFSGYTDIAIGIALILGFILPQNFMRPYLAGSPTEFWHRWHMTLGRFIKDYLYIPLGGNRKGNIRTYINIFVAMVICGLWHGASWNFIIWGAFFGLLLIIDKFISGKIFSESFPYKFSQSYSLKIIAILITQYLVLLGWIIFRINDLNAMFYCIRKYVFIDLPSTTLQFLIVIGGFGMLFLLMLLTLNESVMNKIVNIVTFDYLHHVGNIRIEYWGFIILLLATAIFWLSPTDVPQFIYFSF
jgi:alginate O-acetyltransferase complex protein AlgI